MRRSPNLTLSQLPLSAPNPFSISSPKPSPKIDPSASYFSPSYDAPDKANRGEYVSSNVSIGLSGGSMMVGGDGPHLIRSSLFDSSVYSTGRSHHISASPRTPDDRYSPLGPTDSVRVPPSPNRNRDLHLRSPSLPIPTSPSTGAAFKMPISCVARVTVRHNRYIALTPKSLVSLLLESSSASTPVIAPTTPGTNSRPTSISPIILDMRSHTSFVQSRIKSSLNICIPSTLLRRPAYGVDRILTSLSGVEHLQLSSWSNASSIIVVDSDSVGLLEGGGLSSLLLKFEQAGFTGTLGWLKGGYSAFRSEARATVAGKNLLISGAIGGETIPPPPSTAERVLPILQVRDLPISAFQTASTSTFVHAGLPSNGTPGKNRLGLEKREDSGADTLLNLDIAKRVAHLSTTPAGEARMATNPFFDNIRQNTEALSLTRSLANLAPVEFDLPASTLRSLLPSYLSSLVALEPMERARALAREFYLLEVAERERLEGTMHWHAHIQGKETGETSPVAGFRRFGISAGVELGNLNRYRNIFPYDHARVRLTSYPAGATDYINASHINVESSPLSFIASQGPLPETFDNFWQMCSQEDVGVIVMLTNVFEGGREKCGRYWESNDEWDVLVDDDPSFKMNSGEPESSRAGSEGGGFFDSAPTNPPTQTIVRRTLHIRRRSDPVHIPRRKIRHLQYIAWPDFDVPANPSDVVKLIREVEVAQKLYLEETNGETKRNETRREAAPPVVCMCSAGIGRTGVFILVSTLLDKLKRDRIARSTAGIKRKKSSTKRYRSLPGTIEDSMDLDRAVSSPRLETPSSLAATLLASTLDSPFTQTTTTPTFSPNLPEPLNSDTAPLLRNEPIFATLNELREQRMSMVGNYRQYVCAVECILVGALEELELERKESASYFA